MALRRFLKEAQRYLDKVQNPYPPAERLLYGFGSSAELACWKVFTDQEYGGQSTAQLAPSQDEPGTAVFSGHISTEMDNGGEGRRMQRSGFAGINTQEVQGAYLDMDGVDALAFRMRGDGRKYIASLRTDNWIVGADSHDVWQAFLFAREGEWQEVVLPLGRFLQTHKGRLVETRSQMNAHRIISLGIGVAGGSSIGGSGSSIGGSGSSSGGGIVSSSSSRGDSKEGGASPGLQGPFRLGLAWIKGLRPGGGS